jgi:flagellar hook-associated protein 2
VAISSIGVGSGLDVNGIIAQLMTLERRPLIALGQKEAGLQSRLSAYGLLKGAVSSFQSAMREFSSLSRFQGIRANSADGTIYTASASSIALPGTYAVEVKQLAQAQKLASKSFQNTTDTVGTGSLTIQFGTWSGGVFTANAAKAAQTVTIGAAQGSLGGIRDAINAAKAGVTATIVNDGSGYKLVLSSNDTGAANGLKITVSDGSDASNTDNAGLSQLAYDPAGSAGNGKNLAETVAAQNALLKVDGIDNISKASNTVSDVIQGVTLNLLKPGAPGVSTTLTVSRDTASVKSAVEGFVKAHNDLNKVVRDLTAYNAETRQGAVLQGDSSTRTIANQIRQVLASSLTGLTGSHTALWQIGVSLQTDGALALDGARLQAALDNSFGEIAGLFANLGKPSDSLVSYTSATDKTRPGSYALAVTQLASRGYLNGAGTAALADSVTPGTFNSAFVVDANNDTLALKIDGVSSGTVTLAQGSYATAAALTAEIQSRINGDSALKAAGVTVSVTFDSANDRLVFTSDRYGSVSTLEVTSVDTATAATLGVSTGSGTAGVDAAGTLNGVAASGSGRYLTGASGNDVEGLKVEILGGSTGDRGTVGYSQGYAYRLDKLMTQLLASGGPIESRTTGLNSSIQDIDKRREALETRLELTEQRLRAQFTALDSLVAQLRSTGDYLSRQLASLPAPGGSK